MNNRLKNYIKRTQSYWTERSKTQKVVFGGSMGLIIILLAAVVILSTNTSYVPLYKDLSLQEVGQIKEELDSRGVSYELTSGGSTIEVPREQADALLVDLAALGIPKSGNIDYSFFSENKSWGTTDNEFNIMKLDAMQTELSTLISRIEGINDADVMINMPKEPVFISDAKEEATASIVINTKPGYKFQGGQVNSLYHLVSKAVPNLPTENIVIMNQYSEYYDQTDNSNYQQQTTYTYQQTVKQDIERDVQRRVQQMLGAMVGSDNVIVSVTADIDFTQENRTEELIQPVDVENMEGLPVSIERIQESYSGNPPAGGVAGSGNEDIDNYPGADDDSEGDYELSKETINNEYNRIRKNIVESPYKIRDLGVQVAVDNVKSRSDNDVQYLTAQDEEAVRAGISSILDSMINTSIDKDYGEINPDEKTSIVFQEFSDDLKMPETPAPVIPLWLYITAGALLLVIILLLILLVRTKRKGKVEEVTETTMPAPEQPEIPDLETQEESEETIRRKQLEKMAKDRPEEFAKLLRSWISEE
ncbi:Flagellar M-ring protein [Lentibacillus sp. JNUCC-1]|uniref:flagellar basal-body MS-ring/collar protein FliF n=1 Tax=Lentibacillus sp. JNUCC-1 TaxID=2654513 RepID=UPI0012E8C769|nr:flagellar basal-body MS-ring/collar protein FliF [Lentibacillus sp. JNUCC-1]MUV39967.1 Flagellar M-ring protein [Lentibacillus sp. JNUCC-1]